MSVRTPLAGEINKENCCLCWLPGLSGVLGRLVWSA